MIKNCVYFLFSEFIHSIINKKTIKFVVNLVSINSSKSMPNNMMFVKYIKYAVEWNQ